MKTTLWKRMFAALLAVCLMVATTATGAFALGTRTKGLTRIAEENAAAAGFDLSAYAEKLTDLLDVPLTGDVAADVGSLLTNAQLYNVLIVGVDSRKNDYAGRSDAMVVLTVNPLSQKVVMTSLLRDSYVDIPGHGQERLNEAYNFGGTSLLKKTIRQNYGIKIDAFMVVNFGDLIEFINDIGGVEMTVTKKEVPVINKYTSDQNKEIYGRKDNPEPRLRPHRAPAQSAVRRGEAAPVAAGGQTGPGHREVHASREDGPHRAGTSVPHPRLRDDGPVRDVQHRAAGRGHIQVQASERQGSHRGRPACQPRRLDRGGQLNQMKHPALALLRQRGFLLSSAVL